MASPYPPIHFHFIYSSSVVLQHRIRLKKFIHHIFLSEGIALESLTYVFCSDPYLYELNSIYLNHNTYTDIITFRLSDIGNPIIADIYISLDRVRENTRIQKTTLKEELHRVIFHGVLHLCGYTDKTKSAIKFMRSKENFYLNQYFVSRETF